MATYREHQAQGRRFRVRISATVGGSATGGFEAQPFEILKDTEVEFGQPLAAGTVEEAFERAKQAIERAAQ